MISWPRTKGTVFSGLRGGELGAVVSAPPNHSCRQTFRLRIPLKSSAGIICRRVSGSLPALAAALTAIAVAAAGASLRGPRFAEQDSIAFFRRRGVESFGVILFAWRVLSLFVKYQFDRVRDATATDSAP